MVAFNNIHSINAIVNTNLAYDVFVDNSKSNLSDINHAKL